MTRTLYPRIIVSDRVMVGAHPNYRAGVGWSKYDYAAV